LVTTASHVEHVSMNAPQEQFLKATSIQSTLTFAQSVVLVLMFVRQRLSAFPKELADLCG